MILINDQKINKKIIRMVILALIKFEESFYTWKLAWASIIGEWGCWVGRDKMKEKLSVI